MSFPSSALASMLKATSQHYAQIIVSRLDARIACIEMVGWPALERSLRAEMDAAVEIARSRGFAVSAPCMKVEKVSERPPEKRRRNCAVCGLTVAFAGSTIRYRDGKRVMVCPTCVRLNKEKACQG